MYEKRLAMDLEEIWPGVEEIRQPRGVVRLRENLAPTPKHFNAEHAEIAEFRFSQAFASSVSIVRLQSAAG